MPRTSRVVPLIVVLCPFLAFAQIDAPRPIDDGTGESLEPAEPVRKRRRDRRRSPDAPKVSTDHRIQPQVTPPGEDGAAGVRRAQEQAAKREEAAAPRKPPPPVRASDVTDGQLVDLWRRWQKANAEASPTRAAEARAALLSARQEAGGPELETFSVAVARLAERRYESRDEVGAVELAEFAVQLSPHLPHARFAFARFAFLADPASVLKWGNAAFEAVKAAVMDHRWVRAALGDVGTASLAALLFTAAAAIAVLFLKRARYFLHDFRHLFPRAVARWQTASIALLLLTLPIVLRLGLVAFLAGLLVAVSLYLEARERVVAAVLLSLLAVIPIAGGRLASATSVGGTSAEDVLALEGGGVGASRAAVEVRARAAEGRAQFAELYALGRYELRRGRVQAAAESLKQAALARGGDARVLTTLGNARLAAGDADAAMGLYIQARDADPGLVAAHWNLSVLYARKARTQDAAGEVLAREQADTERALAVKGDPSLAEVDVPADEARLNALVISPPLPWEELSALATLPEASERVESQLSWRLVGASATPIAAGLPLALGLFALGAGALRPNIRASRACEKCGRAVCRRCDKELGIGSALCSQCVNVFARRGAVPPQVKVQKQIEVARHQIRRERFTWLLGIAFTGGGHLFTGHPVRGALFAFGGLFLIFAGAFREGLLRSPYGDIPIAWRLVPVVIAFTFVYLLSLRSLKKAQPR